MRTVFGKRGNETACCILAGSSENLLLGLFISLSKNFPFILPGITSCAVLYVFMLPVHSQFSLGCSLTDELQVGFPVGCSLSAVDIPPSSLLRSPGPPHSHFMSCRNVVNASLTAAPVSQQAIESFALTVKEIAQMLQCFGTELAETELPEDIFSIERILALRTERYCQLKVWLSKALHSHLGSLLLALPAAHSSLPAVCVCVCVCVRCQTRWSSPYVCHAWSRSPCQHTVNCLSCQLPPASSHCLEPALHIWLSGGPWEALSAAWSHPQVGSPLPNPRGCRKLHRVHQQVWSSGLAPGPSAWWLFLEGIKGNVLESIQDEDFCVSTHYRASTM